MAAQPQERVRKRLVWFSPLLLAVALTPAFLQFQYTCERPGNTRLSSLEFDVQGVNRLVFDPTLRAYEVWLPAGATSVTLRAQAADPTAYTTWYVQAGGGTGLSGELGVGGGEVTLDLPPDGNLLGVGVYPSGGAIGKYTVTINPACSPGSPCSDGNECTADYCDPGTEQCVLTPVGDGEACDFGGLPGSCSAGLCEEGLCAGVDCDDGNECTADACVPAIGTCTNDPVADGTACDFGGLPGLCFAGVCEEDASCPVLTSVLVTPLQADVGDQINVTAEASGAGPIDYLWTATGGSFVDPSLPTTAYLCEEAGQQDLTITVSDGTGSCTDESTVTVTCLGSADPCSTEDLDTDGVPDVCPLGFNYIEGTAGPDTIVGTGGPDCIFGLGGNDDIVGGDGLDYICAGDGADIVDGENGDDRIYGEGGDDNINGGDGSDYINGNDGDDTISGGPDNDRLDGGIGTDNIFGNSGADVCLNAANMDPSCEDFADSYCLTFPNGFPCGGGSVCIDGVCGLNDFFCINQPVDCSASDVCLTNGWCDPVCDPIDAANGLCDRCAGQDNPVTDGSPCGSDGACFAGVCDTDFCSTEDLDANGIPDVCPLGYNYIEGTAGPDTIVGTTGPDCIFGLGGDDDIVGGDGMDHICAGEGADIVDGENGDDQIYGAGGDDTINGGDGEDTLSGADGEDTINAGAGNDVVFGGPGGDFISGGPDNDTLDGGHGPDYINGNDGDDTISGGPDNDRLDGGIGTDNIFGNSGADVCLNAANMDPSCEDFADSYCLTFPNGFPCGGGSVCIDGVCVWNGSPPP